MLARKKVEKTKQKQGREQGRTGAGQKRTSPTDPRRVGRAQGTEMAKPCGGADCAPAASQQLSVILKEPPR